MDRLRPSQGKDRTMTKRIDGLEVLTTAIARAYREEVRAVRAERTRRGSFSARSVREIKASADRAGRAAV